MQTRWANKADIPLLVKLDKEVNLTPWSANEYMECLDSKHKKIYLVFDDEHIVACIVYSYILEEAEILQFWVNKRSQRRGIGYNFLAKLLEELRYNNGVKQIFLEVRINNIAAIKVYTRLGFIPAGKRNNYYKVDGWNFDALVMLKCLYQ